MLEEVCRDFDNVTVDGFEGLLTTFCRERDIHAIVKGLRAVSDFDYELQMAQMNASLADVETVFVPTSPAYSFLASSLVKEVATVRRRRLRARARVRAHPPDRAPRRAPGSRRGVSGGCSFAPLPSRPLRFPTICCARTRK